VNHIERISCCSSLDFERNFDPKGSKRALTCCANSIRNLVETAADVVAEQTKRRNEDNSNQCCDQAIFNSRGTFFILTDFSQYSFHLTASVHKCGGFEQ
jgi:hypothetical protein